MMDFSVAKIITAVAASIVLVGLNIFLSTRKNAFFAFIMPVLSFLLSIAFLALALPELSGQYSGETTSVIIRSFFILNIPTFVFIITSLLSRYLSKKL